MVEIKFIIEIAVIIASLAVLLFVFYNNYAGIADQFFGWLGGLADMVRIG